MSREEQRYFHFTSFVFDLDSDELDEIVSNAGLDWNTASPAQVRAVVQAALGDARFYASIAFGNSMFGAGRESE